jgi:hypothetical protein
MFAWDLPVETWRSNLRWEHCLANWHICAVTKVLDAKATSYLQTTTQHALIIRPSRSSEHMSTWGIVNHIPYSSVTWTVLSLSFFRKNYNLFIMSCANRFGPLDEDLMVVSCRLNRCYIWGTWNIAYPLPPDYQFTFLDPWTRMHACIPAHWYLNLLRTHAPLVKIGGCSSIDDNVDLLKQLF